jgi:hypothetical protein
MLRVGLPMRAEEPRGARDGGGTDSGGETSGGARPRAGAARDPPAGPFGRGGHMADAGRGAL